MSLVLYQFPISHYCEKVRWALDYKGLQYKTKSMVPGAHIKITTKMAPRSSVPVLEHNGKAVQGSSQIITYLDEQFPDKKLTPVNSQAKQAALEWEKYLDNEIGIHVRRYLYHTVLQHRGLSVGFFTAGAPFWTKPILWIAFPKLVKRMRKFMDINPATAEQSKQHIEKALKRINEAVVDNKFLTSEGFSRADLTAAALLAPIFMPPQYGMQWPSHFPEPLETEVKAMAPQLEWAKAIYAKYR